MVSPSAMVPTGADAAGIGISGHGSQFVHFALGKFPIGNDHADSRVGIKERCPFADGIQRLAAVGKTGAVLCLQTSQLLTIFRIANIAQCH